MVRAREYVLLRRSGAYTGEIAPSMLEEAGVKYVVLSDTLREENTFKETDETDKQKSFKGI